VSDLAADHRSGIPTDHSGTFTKLAGSSFAYLRQSAPGLARCVTNLEVGHALHEATFASLFLVMVLTSHGFVGLLRSARRSGGAGEDLDVLLAVTHRRQAQHGEGVGHGQIGQTMHRLP
jgi:hypothetical protein